MKILKNKVRGGSHKLLYGNIGRRISKWQRKIFGYPDRKRYNASKMNFMLNRFFLLSGGAIVCLALKSVMHANAPPKGKRLQ